MKRCVSNSSPTKIFPRKNKQSLCVKYSESSIGRYVFDKKIGEGAFSSVIKVKYSKNPRISFACKVVNKKSLSEDEKAKISFEREVRINHQLHHPGHVEMVDIISDDQNYYIIMQYCPGGSLLDYIRKHNGPLKEEEAKPLFKQIIETLEYIQEMGVSHRDLKPENILFNSSHKLVIADFGFSRFVEQPIKSSPSQSRKNLVKSRCGSTDYASPEIVSGGKEPYDGFASDIWSCGVILYEMVTKRRPWKLSRNQSEIIKQIINGEYEIPAYLSEACQDLIKQMLTIDADKRITLSMILKHDWLKDVPKQFDVIKEMKYSGVSLRRVDQFFGLDESIESPLLSNEFTDKKSFPKSNSSKNIEFSKQITELTKPFAYRKKLNSSGNIKSSTIKENLSHQMSNQSTNPKLPRLKTYKTSSHITPPQNPNLPHIVRPPESSKINHGQRRHKALKPLKTDMKFDPATSNLLNSTDGKPKIHPPLEVRPPAVGPPSKSPRRYGGAKQALNSRIASVNKF